jgi:energy-coupling factor transporter ATP-binding protein EcfA2
VIDDVLVEADETILMTTHDVHLAHRIAGRVLSLRAGRLSAGLSVNVLEGRVVEGCFVTEHGHGIALPPTTFAGRSGSSRVIIDPRRLAVSLGSPAPGARNLLRGHLSSIRELGDDVWLEVDCGDRLTAIMSRTAYEREGLNLHREVLVAFGPDAVEVL